MSEKNTPDPEQIADNVVSIHKFAAEHGKVLGDHPEYIHTLAEKRNLRSDVSIGTDAALDSETTSLPVAETPPISKTEEAVTKVFLSPQSPLRQLSAMQLRAMGIKVPHEDDENVAIMQASGRKQNGAVHKHRHGRSNTPDQSA